MVSPNNVVKFIGSNDIKWVDIHFTDLLGTLHRYSVSGVNIIEESFDKGVEGPDLGEVFQGVEEKDLIMVPDSRTFARIPWENSVARLISSAKIALSDERYLGDPRYVIEHMETNVKAAGITAARISTDIEFYIFDNVSLDKSTLGQSSSYLIDSREASWNPSAFWTNKNGAYVNQPYDISSAMRTQLAETMMGNFGYPIEYHSHGKGATSQQKIVSSLSLLKDAADAVSTLKFVARNASFLTNSISTFMPLPIPTEKGSSLSIGQTLWKRDRNIFYDARDKYAQISQNARYYIGGILEHAHAICAFTNPTVNSYRRLKVDPYYVAWSKHTTGGMVKTPHMKENRDLDKKISLVSGDSSMNPYLAYPVVIAAGLDGIKKKIDPGDPVDRRVDKLSMKERRQHKVRPLPGSLMEALEGLQSDEKFLKGVIPSEMLENYMELKLEEVSSIESGVTAQEMQKYFNV